MNDTGVIAIAPSIEYYHRNLAAIIEKEGRLPVPQDLESRFKVHMARVSSGRVWEDTKVVRLPFGGTFQLLDLLLYIARERYTHRTVRHIHDYDDA